MKKYKVEFFLMVDPTKGDETFPKSYEVEAESESEAYKKAEELKDKDEPNIAQRSVFDYDVTEISE